MGMLFSHMSDRLPALRQQTRRGTACYDFVATGRNRARDGHIEAKRCEHITRLRFKVTIWPHHDRTPPVPGDLIRWNPAKDVDSLRTYVLVAISPMRGAQAVYDAEINALVPDVAVAGARYRDTSQGVLVPVPEPVTIGRFAP